MPDLEWLFLVGKGGVGKTTIACSLGIELSKLHDSVLIISTNSTYSLSDTFNQQFTHNPLKVEGYNNLYCMEYNIDNIDNNTYLVENTIAELGLINEIYQNIPGMRETVEYIYLLSSTLNMPYKIIIFDEAPKKHILQLCKHPIQLNKLMGKFKSTGLISIVKSILSIIVDLNNNTLEDILLQFNNIVTNVYNKLIDNNRTAFISVCTPEFNSVFETERFIQLLYKYEIESNIMFVNRVIEDDQLELGISLRRNQRKYIDIITKLYQEIGFNVVYIPYINFEVRKQKTLHTFANLLYETPK